MLLAKKIKQMHSGAEKPDIVLGLPRGGVVVASEIARHFFVPLDMISVEKIGHPYQEEYAVAAVTEDGYVVKNKYEIERVDKKWLKETIEKKKNEAQQRRMEYFKESRFPILNGKTVILADDGIATGLTMEAAVLSAQAKNPKRLIVAVPVASASAVNRLEAESIEVITLLMPEDTGFSGAVGEYYEDFSQVTDEEAKKLFLSG